MKVGDLVKIRADDIEIKDAIGTVLGPWNAPAGGFRSASAWWEVFVSNGRIICWPESQMEVIKNA